MPFGFTDARGMAVEVLSALAERLHRARPDLDRIAPRVNVTLTGHVEGTWTVTLRTGEIADGASDGAVTMALAWRDLEELSRAKGPSAWKRALEDRVIRVSGPREIAESFRRVLDAATQDQRDDRW